MPKTMQSCSIHTEMIKSPDGKGKKRMHNYNSSYYIKNMLESSGPLLTGSCVSRVSASNSTAVLCGELNCTAGLRRAKAAGAAPPRPGEAFQDPSAGRGHHQSRCVRIHRRGLKEMVLLARCLDPPPPSQEETSLPPRYTSGRPPVASRYDENVPLSA